MAFLFLFLLMVSQNCPASWCLFNPAWHRKKELVKAIHGGVFFLARHLLKDVVDVAVFKLLGRSLNWPQPITSGLVFSSLTSQWCCGRSCHCHIVAFCCLSLDVQGSIHAALVTPKRWEKKKVPSLVSSSQEEGAKSAVPRFDFAADILALVRQDPPLCAVRRLRPLDY